MFATTDMLVWRLYTKLVVRNVIVQIDAIAEIRMCKSRQYGYGAPCN